MGSETVWPLCLSYLLILLVNDIHQHKTKSAFSFRFLAIPFVGLPVGQPAQLQTTVTQSKHIFALCLAELIPRDHFYISSCYLE